MTTVVIAPEQAAVFDLDGVLTRTALQHRAAWKATLDPLLVARGLAPFGEDDYLRHVDGVPRRDGLRRFLGSRGISLADAALEELARLKNTAYLRILSDQGVAPYPDARELLRELREAGRPVAVISASRNCRAVLAAANLAPLVQVVVDGVDLERLGLAGKPAPDVFLAAAAQLGLAPDRCVAFEDALAGVQAARAAGYGCVVGLHRGAAPAELLRSGAHVAAPDLRRVAILRAVPSLPRASAAAVHERRAGRALAIFLDCDGTLAPIVQRAPDAVVPPATRDVLAHLARSCTVSVVSGRDMATLRRMMDLPGLLYAAEHGLRIEGPGGQRFEHPGAEGAHEALAAVGGDLARIVAAVPGAWVEEKRFARAVHFREVGDALVPALERQVRDLAAREPRLRVQPGKRVLELQPAIDWDKGRAVEWLLERLGLERSRTCPFFAGDDLTDEHAFRAIAGDGACVIVGEEDRLTAAHLRVRDPEELRELLEELG